eukprot:CAMPEP_0206051176 /NCGR_PEP_ID=MMETSP1466-20131121/30848_1 /ASSEMBLY_ACC=CAM_ASM_001126 /TAXON_ID=44452 /ORGANISM="Pavlova gyrans, Strain CCMP608" /LENGTH=106 /DNA_ID=CAMNT_0053426301 /DNA_START=1 /DNA_END=318 /DNA_ORIENTATION=-
MPGHLELGIPNGLHFFEPRYRRLVQTAMARDWRFVFAVSNPSVGSVAFMCELHNVTVYADGRADVHALPVSRCVIRTSAYDNFSAVHLPLLRCIVEVLPLPSPEVF